MMPETNAEERQNDALPEDFSAELLILEDMGVPTEKLERINSAAAARRLIEYYEKKAPKADQRKENMMTLPEKGGKNLMPLPPPEETTQKRVQNSETRLNALHPANLPDGARRNSAARIMILFDEEHPGGRVF